MPTPIATSSRMRPRSDHGNANSDAVPVTAGAAWASAVAVPCAWLSSARLWPGGTWRLMPATPESPAPAALARHTTLFNSIAAPGLRPALVAGGGSVTGNPRPLTVQSCLTGSDRGSRQPDCSAYRLRVATFGGGRLGVW